MNNNYILKRFLDMMHYGRKMKQETRKVRMGDNSIVNRRTPRGETFSVLQMVIKVFFLNLQPLYVGFQNLYRVRKKSWIKFYFLN